MRNAAENPPRKRRSPYRRHAKHKAGTTLEEMEPEIQKALAELPSWLARHGHRANLH